MNPYLLLAISMTACLLGGCATKLFVTRYAGSPLPRYVYNALSSFAALVVLILWNGAFQASLFTLLLGIVFGAVTVTQQIFSMKAMETGPWSYTSVITSLSTIIPTLSGVLLFHETISPVQIIGIVLMLACILLSADLKAEKGSASFKWILYCAVLFISTGAIGVLQKLHQSTPHKGELGEFLIISFSIPCLYLALCTARLVSREKEERAHLRALLSVLPIVLMAVSGIAVAVNNRLNLLLSGLLDSSIMFPVVNGGGLILTTLSATLFFKERLTKKQWVGMVIGLTAVILLCNPF